MGRSSKRSTTYAVKDYKLKIERIGLAGSSFGIRTILFKKSRRVSSWPRKGWRQYPGGTDFSVVTRDIVRFVKFPGLNVGNLSEKVRKLLDQ